MWPVSEAEVYAVVLVLAAVYIVVSFALGRYRRPPPFLGERGQKPHLRMDRVFDGATFGASVVLLMGIFDPQIIVHLGNTKMFLVIAGLSGIVYSLYALVTK